MPQGAQDFERNVRVCKALTREYGLTLGKDKQKVKRSHLRGRDAAKYRIYDAIQSVLTPGRYSFAGSKIDAFISFRHLDNFLSGGLGGGTGSDLKWRDDDREKNKHNTNHIRRSGRR